MEQRKVAAVAEVELTRGAKGEYRWVVKTAATDPRIAVEDVVAMDTELRIQYYPEEIAKQVRQELSEHIQEQLRQKEERDGN